MKSGIAFAQVHNSSATENLSVREEAGSLVNRQDDSTKTKKREPLCALTTDSIVVMMLLMMVLQL